MNDFYCEGIFSGKVEVDKVKETESVLAFYHTKPTWTTHIVVVPKQHIVNLTDADPKIISEIFEVIKQIIVMKEFNESNFKIISNGGSFQDSKHLHFHLVSGDKI